MIIFDRQNNSQMKIKDRIKAYLKLKDIEKARKDKEETVKLILNTITKDKTIKEQINLVQLILKEFEDRLVSVEKQSVKDLECIYQYQGEV